MNKIYLKCEKCGADFTHRDPYPHDIERSKTYRDWTYEHVTLCPSCYHRASYAFELNKALTELAPVLALYPLPDITKGSAKQIDYATDLRNQYIAHNCALIQNYWWANDPATISPEQVQYNALLQGMDVASMHAMMSTKAQQAVAFDYDKYQHMCSIVYNNDAAAIIQTAHSRRN